MKVVFDCGCEMTATEIRYCRNPVRDECRLERGRAPWPIGQLGKLLFEALTSHPLLRWECGCQDRSEKDGTFVEVHCEAELCVRGADQKSWMKFIL